MPVVSASIDGRVIRRKAQTRMRMAPEAALREGRMAPFISSGQAGQTPAEDKHPREGRLRRNDGRKRPSHLGVTGATKR
jgi:hypothetical protein